MAKLSAHGEKLDQLDYAGFRLALMADGKILRNDGSGWKKYKSVKPGLDVRAHMARKREFYNKKMAACPNYAAFVRGLKDLCAFRNHFTVRATIEMMPEDPDGVWSMLDDHGIHADVSDIVELCRNCVAGEKEMAAYLRAMKK